MAKIPLINFNAPMQRAKLLQYYIEIFNEIPSGSHMIRSYALMEKIVMEKFAASQLVLVSKLDKNGNVVYPEIEKFDKLKNLALNNENVHERKLAFYLSAKQFVKISEITLTLPEQTNAKVTKI